LFKDSQFNTDLINKFEELDLNENLSVKEDNFTKYVLSNKSYADDGADESDGFDSDGDNEFEHNDEDDEEDEDAIDDEQHNKHKSLSHDTGKNYHFFVVRPCKRTSRVVGSSSKSAAVMSRQMSSYASDNEYDSMDDEDDNTSLDSLDDRDVLNDDDDDENEANLSGNEGSDDDEIDQHKDDYEIFYHEVIELLKSGLKENLDPDNIILGNQINKKCLRTNLRIFFN
jgi:hypothetical protein